LALGLPTDDEIEQTAPESTRFPNVVPIVPSQPVILKTRHPPCSGPLIVTPKFPVSVPSESFFAQMIEFAPLVSADVTHPVGKLPVLESPSVAMRARMRSPDARFVGYVSVQLTELLVTVLA
jgi:hypothetical protein